MTQGWKFAYLEGVRKPNFIYMLREYKTGDKAYNNTSLLLGRADFFLMKIYCMEGIVIYAAVPTLLTVVGSIPTCVNTLCEPEAIVLNLFFCGLSVKKLS